MTIGFLPGLLNTRRAAIRRIVGGAAKDLLIRLCVILFKERAERRKPFGPV